MMKIKLYQEYSDVKLERFEYIKNTNFIRRMILKFFVIFIV